MMLLLQLLDVSFNPHNNSVKYYYLYVIDG